MRHPSPSVKDDSYHNISVVLVKGAVITRFPDPEKILRFRVVHLIIIAAYVLLDLPYAHIGRSGGAFFRGAVMTQFPDLKDPSNSRFAIKIKLKELLLLLLLLR